MGLLVVVPANLLYGDNPLYHEGIFWLEAGTVFAILSQQYGFTLNVKSNLGDLLQMNVLVVLSLFVQVYCRFYKYLVVSLTLLTTHWENPLWSSPDWYPFMLMHTTTSLVSTVALFLVSVMFLIDNSKKVMKFSSLLRERTIPQMFEGQGVSSSSSSSLKVKSL